MSAVPTIPIPTFAINLKSRPDRKKHILSEFEGREEFQLTIVTPEKHKIGATSLWNTIKKIVESSQVVGSDCILICEDDHQFTEHYKKEVLIKSITDAQSFHADILLGGVSSVESIFPISEYLVWIEGFSGSQFVVVFRNFFQAIIEASFEDFESADYKMSELTNKKFLLFPFISIQKEFGYSDATPTRANLSVDVSNYFNSTSESIKILLQGSRYYNLSKINEPYGFEIKHGFAVKTYLVSTPKSLRKLKAITREFEGRTEFNLAFVSTKSNEEIDFWKMLRTIVTKAIADGEEVIVICDDNHIFSESYSSSSFINCIFSAHQRGADILLGNTTGEFNHALFVSWQSLWVNHFSNSNFIILYRKFFQRILDSPFDGVFFSKSLLSSLSNVKFVIYPFISENASSQRQEARNRETNPTIHPKNSFANAAKRFKVIENAYKDFLFNLSLRENKE